MSDQNCVHNISLVGLSSLSTIAKELPIPRQNDSKKDEQKPLFDSKSLEQSDAELVGELTGKSSNDSVISRVNLKLPSITYELLSHSSRLYMMNAILMPFKTFLSCQTSYRLPQDY